MIHTGRFTEFVLEFMKIHNDDVMWEFFLHKVEEKSFEDFKSELEIPEVESANVETTISDSYNILNGFIPITEGVKDGTI